MIPIPTSRVFRSRRGALMWSFWVLVATVMAVGFADPPASKPDAAAHATDAMGMAVDDKDMKELMRVMNAS